MALLGQRPQRPCVEGQPLVIVLHELGEVEESSDSLRGDGGAGKGRLQAARGRNKFGVGKSDITQGG